MEEPKGGYSLSVILHAYQLPRIKRKNTIPKVFRLKLMTLDASNDCLLAINSFPINLENKNNNCFNILHNLNRAEHHELNTMLKIIGTMEMTHYKSKYYF